MQAVGARQEVERLEDEADLLVADGGQFVVLHRATFLPLNSYLPVVGVSRQPSMFIMVDLPLPLGPMMARYSLRRMLERHPAQGVDGFAAHLVLLRDVLDVDDQRGPGRSARGLPPTGGVGAVRGSVRAVSLMAGASWPEGWAGRSALRRGFFQGDGGAVLQEARDGPVAAADDLLAGADALLDFQRGVVVDAGFTTRIRTVPPVFTKRTFRQFVALGLFAVGERLAFLQVHGVAAFAALGGFAAWP